VRYPPVVTPLAIQLDDGTVLEGTCDLNLAWTWAAHVHGSEWNEMTYTRQCAQVAVALNKVRELHAEATEEAQL
jgi:hypothetical protein